MNGNLDLGRPRSGRRFFPFSDILYHKNLLISIVSWSGDWHPPPHKSVGCKSPPLQDAIGYLGTKKVGTVLSTGPWARGRMDLKITVVSLLLQSCDVFFMAVKLLTCRLHVYTIAWCFLLLRKKSCRHNSGDQCPPMSTFFIFFTHCSACTASGYHHDSTVTPWYVLGVD